MGTEGEASSGASSTPSSLAFTFYVPAKHLEVVEGGGGSLRLHLCQVRLVTIATVSFFVGRQRALRYALGADYRGCIFKRVHSLRCARIIDVRKQHVLYKFSTKKLDAGRSFHQQLSDAASSF